MNDENTPEMKMYKALVEQEVALNADLQTINHIYGKITSSHDYKDFAKKTNDLRVKVESQVKEVTNKIKQWDQHFKQQAQYAEVIQFESTIKELWDKYSAH